MSYAHLVAAGSWERGMLMRTFATRAMSNVINLNKFRKAKARAEKEQRAETNRRLHGRTKAERQRDFLQKQQLEKRVDGARLESPRSDSEE